MNKKINRERLLLATLVGVAFLGFLLWSIQQYQNDEKVLAYGVQANTTNPLKNTMVQIGSPKMNQPVKSPVTVAGQANTTDNAVKIRIKDQNGLVLANATAKTKESNKLSPFSLQVKYKKPAAAKGVVEIFLISPKDNSEIYKISIPVIFQD